MAWDITTVWYDWAFLQINEDSAPWWMSMSLDRTKLYIVWYSNDRIYQYTMSTPWDILTATYDLKSLYVWWQELSPYWVFIKWDWSSIYVSWVYTDRIYQYNLSTNFDISTASYSWLSISVWWADIIPRDFCITYDWVNLYIIWDSWNEINQYIMSTPWSINTSAYVWRKDVSSEVIYPFWVTIRPDWTYIYMSWWWADRVFEYQLITPYLLSTAVYTWNSYRFLEDSNPFWLYIEQNWLKMYMTWWTNDRVYQYSLWGSQELEYLYYYWLEYSTFITWYNVWWATQTKLSDHFNFYAPALNSTDSTFVTNGLIDLTWVAFIEVNWESISSPYWMILSAWTNKTIRARLDEAVLAVRRPWAFWPTDYQLDVTALSWSYYVKAAIEWAWFDGWLVSEMNVYSIKLIYWTWEVIENAILFWTNF